MFTEWDERFDLLVGADIQDCDTEPCMDSGVHDLLHGEVEQEEITYEPRKSSADKHSRHVIEWIRDRR